MKEIITIQLGNYANFVGSHFWNFQWLLTLESFKFSDRVLCCILFLISLPPFRVSAFSFLLSFQDELLGLADSPDSDQIFRNHGLNMDILYRMGETQQGILTYTPRLVSVDFQGEACSQAPFAMKRRHEAPFSGSGKVILHCIWWIEILFKCLLAIGPVTPLQTMCRTGPVTTHKSQPSKKNLFLQSLYDEEGSKSGSSMSCESRNNNSRTEVQDKDIVDCLENSVLYWTDFSKVHYHPQSIYELSGLWSDVQDFNNYGIGREAFSGGLRADEISERLRFFVEECDLPQGFQFIVDDSGGFSGVAAEFLENISDEYTNIPVLLYSVRSPEFCSDPGSRKQTISRKLHNAVSFTKLSAFCKLIAPVGLPSLNVGRMSKYLHLEDGKPYHTSSVYASAIHSISLPFRMQPIGPSAQFSCTSGAVDIKELVQMLASGARQNTVTSLEVSMPAPTFSGMQSQQSLLENLQPLNPEIADVEDMHALEAMVVHGAFASGSKRASISEAKDAVQAAYYASAIEKKPKFSHLSIAQCPLPIPLPFPSIFKNLVGQHGELSNTPISDCPFTRGSLEVHSVPMAARLRSSNAILPFLEGRFENLRKFGISRGALGAELLKSWGFEREDVEEMGETLSGMVMALSSGSQMSSDSD
ncbi:misato-like protein [Striga asiatica]|uniref:Misato-like protein n=1 Tax=Striga asiatica TaxID=4170 RepID=A0A5A7QFF0_STRAF|nr:misato-like protein [Striga asiatica]